MTFAFALTLLGLGFVGAFVSGLVGVGGAIVMIPLLYYVPPWVGIGALDMRAVSGVTMVQVLAASLVGAWTHGRHAAVHRPLALVGGIAMALASFAGAVASRHVPPRALLAVFAVMTTVALPLMVVRPTARDERAAPESLEVSRAAAALAFAAIGVASGLIGAGGAWLTIPVMMALLRLPMRMAIGTSLAVTGMAAVTGVVGKAFTGQIPIGPAVVVVLGSLVGARMGSTVSQRAPVRLLRGVLAGIVLLVALRVWWDVLGH